MYPWGDGQRLHTGFMMKPASRSLHDNSAALGYFTESPVDCPKCLKPHLRHPAIPDATFTILISCPHSSDPDPIFELYPNKAVTAILPDQHRWCTPLGNVVVFKHPLTDPPSATNRTLPIIDILPADLPFVDELVRR
jgi:hypothetical protein